MKSKIFRRTAGQSGESLHAQATDLPKAFIAALVVASWTQHFFGVSLPIWGTFTMGRQSALSSDLVVNYDALSGSNAWSLSWNDTDNDAIKSAYFKPAGRNSRSRLCHPVLARLSVGCLSDNTVFSVGETRARTNEVLRWL